MSEITLKIAIPENFETIFQEFLTGHATQISPAPIEDETWTIEDICKALKLKKSKVYSLTMQTGPGTLPRHKIGRELRFKKTEVMTWFEKQRVTGEI